MRIASTWLLAAWMAGCTHLSADVERTVAEDRVVRTSSHELDSHTVLQVRHAALFFVDGTRKDYGTVGIVGTLEGVRVLGVQPDLPALYPHAALATVELVTRVDTHTVSATMRESSPMPALFATLGAVFLAPAMVLVAKALLR